MFSFIVGGLSVAVLAFGEFHPTQSSRVRVSEGFLCSSAMTAIISVMHSTMLLFTFEGYETAMRKDLVIAWSPVVFSGRVYRAICVGAKVLVLWEEQGMVGCNCRLLSRSFITLLFMYTVQYCTVSIPD